MRLLLERILRQPESDLSRWKVSLSLIQSPERSRDGHDSLHGFPGRIEATGDSAARFFDRRGKHNEPCEFLR